MGNSTGKIDNLHIVPDTREPVAREPVVNEPVMKKHTTPRISPDEGSNVKNDVDELAKLKVNSMEFKDAFIRILAKINGENAVLSHDNSQLLFLVDLPEKEVVAEMVAKTAFERYYNRNKQIRKTCECSNI